MWCHHRQLTLPAPVQVRDSFGNRGSIRCMLAAGQTKAQAPRLVVCGPQSALRFAIVRNIGKRPPRKAQGGPQNKRAAVPVRVPAVVSSDSEAESVSGAEQ